MCGTHAYPFRVHCTMCTVFNSIFSEATQRHQRSKLPMACLIWHKLWLDSVCCICIFSNIIFWYFLCYQYGCYHREA